MRDERDEERETETSARETEITKTNFRKPPESRQRRDRETQKHERNTDTYRDRDTQKHERNRDTYRNRDTDRESERETESNDLETEAFSVL